MFSERFDTRQPAAEFYPQWNAAIGRYQCVLRQGRALIIYQSELDADVAAHLLDWARHGLSIVVVHGAREAKLVMRDLYTTHERAAARTPGLDDRDQELAATMAELLSLPSVAEVDDPALTLPALRRLGLRGRAEFVQDNPNVLTYLREDGDLLHLYAYHYLYETGEPTEVEIALHGPGTAYRIDGWSGSIRPHRGVRYSDERTVVRLRLSPGETALITLDRSAGAGAPSEPATYAPVAEIPTWDIAVESWDAGELQLITEDRGLGYVTREVRPTTAVTRIDAGTGELRPWLSLVGPEVSGVADYRSTVRLDERGGARLLLDLGSTAGGLGSVSVNGAAARGFDTSRPIVDVTDDVRAGDNTIHVRVSSSLNNRLLARGYYDRVPDIMLELFGREGTQQTEPHPHGLLGPVRLLREA